MATPLDELNAQYAPPGGKLIELTDKAEIKRQLESKTSCCWQAGTRLDDTGWVLLATDRPNQFVCREENLP